jgi:hypothetical protein
MKLFYDLRVDRLVAAPGQDSVITGLGGKAGDGATEVKLIFGRSSDPTSATSIVEAPTWTPENLPGGTVIKIGIKEDDAYSDGTLLASNATWTHDAGTYTYTGSLDLNTNEIDTALNRDDANAANDVASLSCNFELTYQPGGSGGWRSSVEPVEFTIYHDILVGDEATPTNAGDPTQYLLKASAAEYLPTTTSKIGGTAADLDAVPTVAVTVGKLVQFVDQDESPSVLRTYRLITGTTAESSPTVIRPDDYNASTNTKIWQQVQVDASAVLPVEVTQAEAEAGTVTSARTFTPERVKQAILALETSKGVASSVANEVVLFNGTDGKQLKRATTTGIAKLTSGVLSAATAGTDYVAGGAVTSSGLTMSTARLLGRTTASTGAVQEIAAGSGLALTGGTLACGGAITASGMTMSTARLIGRTTASSGAAEEISIGANLSMTAGTLSATGINYLPSGVVSLTADTSLVYATHNGNYIEATGSTSTVTISTQASGSWATDSHFWIANRRDSGTLTIARASGVTLILAGSTSANITIAHTDRPIHIWRSASDVWRVIS